MRGIVTTSLAVLCLVAELGSVAHVVLVKHAVCPEHGETVHRSADAASPDHEAPAASATARSFPAHGADSHEHCGLAFSRDSHRSRRDVVQTPPHGAGPRCGSPCSLEALPTIAIIRIAPKSSPPV